MGSHNATLLATWQRWLSRLYPITPTEAGTRFSNPRGMQDWVELGGGSSYSLPVKDRRSPVSKIAMQCHGWESNPRAQCPHRAMCQINMAIRYLWNEPLVKWQAYTYLIAAAFQIKTNTSCLPLYTQRTCKHLRGAAAAAVGPCYQLKLETEASYGFNIDILN